MPELETCPVVVGDEEIPPTERQLPAVHDPRTALEAVLDRLGGDEIGVLVRIAERLILGAGTYGPLQIARDGRDFRGEAREEIEDALIYLACAWLKAEVTA